ncbi:hypothetical protein Tco_1270282, partial [Tanacetum coccineum]
MTHQIPTTTTTKTTNVIPPIIPPITITVQFQSPFLSSPPKTTSQLEGELIKKDKGKYVMSLKDAEEKEIESDSKTKVRISEEQIKEQKRIKSSVKADLAK